MKKFTFFFFIAVLFSACSTCRPAAKDYSGVEYFKAVGYKEAPLFKNYQKNKK